VNKLITVIHYNHPALLVDMTGTTFTDQALGEFIRSRSIPAAPVVATAGEREAAQMAEVARRRSRAAVLAQAIIASVMVLLVNDDLETLETLHELARK
jgi:hypothetical protein